MKFPLFNCWRTFALFAALSGVRVFGQEPGAVTKIRDVVIYSNAVFHCAFPSIVQRPNGELLVAFRRAPDRRVWGELSFRHTDCNSYLELVRSKDGGDSWSPTPQLIYADPFGGSQDPCMVQLSDHSILCTTYQWAMLRAASREKLSNLGMSDEFAFNGGRILRSRDGGGHWDEPIVPPPVPEATVRDVFGKTVSAYNRGAMCEGRDGRLFWVVANSGHQKPDLTWTDLMISSDHGTTWRYSCPVARDENEKMAFNETSIYETPKGVLVAVLRTEGAIDHLATARSTDGGKSFAHWEDSGVLGHPAYLMRLPDQRALLVYGYRHAPLGIRARVLNAECTDFATAPEIILRDDGGNGDLGYPWATMVSKHRALVVYYFNHDNGPRYIAGTFLDVK